MEAKDWQNHLDSLQSLSDADLLKAYDPATMESIGVYKCFAENETHESRDWILKYFKKLTDFYAKISNSDYGVIVLKN